MPMAGANVGKPKIDLWRCCNCNLVTGDFLAMLERARAQEEKRRTEATR